MKMMLCPGVYINTNFTPLGSLSSLYAVHLRSKAVLSRKALSTDFINDCNVIRNPKTFCDVAEASCCDWSMNWGYVLLDFIQPITYCFRRKFTGVFVPKWRILAYLFRGSVVYLAKNLCSGYTSQPI